MEASKYEAAVNKVLEAFDLDATDVTMVRVEPDATVVRKVKLEDGKRLLVDEVIKRDDVKIGPAYIAGFLTLDGFTKAIEEMNKDGYKPSDIAKALGIKF